MSRFSKLSPAQWAELSRRHLLGEPMRALAREFGIAENAIRRRISTQCAQIRRAAFALADAQNELAALPVAEQHRVLRMVAAMQSRPGIKEPTP
jgi:hypothetical protein